MSEVQKDNDLDQKKQARSKPWNSPYTTTVILASTSIFEIQQSKKNYKYWQMIASMFPKLKRSSTFTFKE